jgi:hypothetical protein
MDHVPQERINFVSGIISVSLLAHDPHEKCVNMSTNSESLPFKTVSPEHLTIPTFSMITTTKVIQCSTMLSGKDGSRVKCLDLTRWQSSSNLTREPTFTVSTWSGDSPNPLQHQPNGQLITDLVQAKKQLPPLPPLPPPPPPLILTSVLLANITATRRPSVPILMTDSCVHADLVLRELVSNAVTLTSVLLATMFALFTPTVLTKLVPSNATANLDSLVMVSLVTKSTNVPLELITALPKQPVSTPKVHLPVDVTRDSKEMESTVSTLTSVRLEPIHVMKMPSA